MSMEMKCFRCIYFVILVFKWVENSLLNTPLHTKTDILSKFQVSATSGLSCALSIIGYPTQGIFLVIPEDVATGFAAIYGFSPRILTANDHRFGFGFRFGNHADLQVLYELGPQTVTQPLQPTLRVRSARVRERVVRRRPILEFLLRAGFLRESDFEVNYERDEPR